MSGGAQDFDITQITVYYSIAATGLLMVETGAVRLTRRSRPKNYGDGIFVLHDWGKRVRAVVVCFLMTFLALPACIFWIGLASGELLAVIEGWSFSDGYKYVICNMLGIGPMVSLAPESIWGNIVDILISCLAMLIGTTILGLSACLSLTNQWLGTIPPTAGGLARAMLLYIPIMMLIIAVVTGACMAAIEEWAFSDGFLYMVGALCGIQDPLTQASPSSDFGNFFSALCFLIELLLGGGIIGVIGGHPAFATFVDSLQGLDTQPAEDERAGDEGTASDTRPADDERAGGEGSPKEQSATKIPSSCTAEARE